MKAKIIAALAATALVDCSSIIEGTQQVKVDTQPGGADCALELQGRVIARVDGTPGFATINKSRYDITVRCKKAGYKDAYINRWRLRNAISGKMVLSQEAKQDKDTASAATMGYDEYKLYDVVVSLALVPMGSVTPTETPTRIPVPVSVSPATK